MQLVKPFEFKFRFVQNGTATRIGYRQGICHRYRTQPQRRRACLSQHHRFIRAVLLDPIYGAAQAVAGGACPESLGLIVALEETGYTGEATARKSSLLKGWSAAKARKMGANAVKLLVYYHPDTGQLAESQENFVRSVIVDCRMQDLPLFLEAVSYNPTAGANKSSPEFARNLPEMICTIARRLGALQPEVLKLEFPVDPLHSSDEAVWRAACERVTEAAPCPWALLSGGLDFRIFTRQVEAACKSGASGYPTSATSPG